MSALAKLRDARLTRRLDKKAQLLMAQVSMSYEDAMQLLERARTGDKAAQMQIQAARQGSSTRREDAHPCMCREALQTEYSKTNTTSEGASSDLTAEFGQSPVSSDCGGA